MRLSEIEDERALDVLAEIIDPIAEIATDDVVQNIYKSGKPKIMIVKEMLKNHKKAVIAIMAALDGEKPENYHFNILSLPAKLLEILNDPEVDELFRSQGQMTEQPSSGSATGNTGGAGA